MKSIKKLIFVMAALAAVFGFVACSDDDDDDDGPSKVAVYKADDSDDMGSDIYTLTFYDDHTFSMYWEEDDWSATLCKGKYEGNPEGDGDIIITVKKIFNGEKFVDPPISWRDPFPVTVTGRKGSFPVALDEYNERYLEFTRQ